MPLLDHFHPPLDERIPWESFHSSWATRIADALNDRWLPPEFLAAEHAHAGRVEIDVATYENATTASPSTSNGGTALTLAAPVWAPPAPARTMPAVFPDTFEVRVFSTCGGLTLVGAIELISPGNKDRPAEQRAFASKCASYLSQGISVIIVDIVTNRRANLHNEILRLMEAADTLQLPAEVELYAVAYRPLRRGQGDDIDVWRSPLALGRALPTLPLGLRGDLAIPVDFEATYADACLRKRLTGS